MEKMKVFFSVTLLLFVLCSCSKKEEEPSDWSRWTSVNIRLMEDDRVKLPHNSAKQIFKELKNPNTMSMIAASTGYSKNELEDISLRFDNKELEVRIYLTGNNKEMFNIITNKIKYYAENRLGGHTKEYLVASLDNNKNENITDADLKNFLELYPDLPSTWLKKIYQETIIKNNEQVRVVYYVLIDDTIAWTNALYYRKDGSFDKFLGEQKRDAKEYESKYHDIIVKINQKAKEKMEHENISGLGSIHSFWEYKKELLKKEGIDWKSPSELNPSTHFD